MSRLAWSALLFGWGLLSGACGDRATLAASPVGQPEVSPEVRATLPIGLRSGRTKTFQTWDVPPGFERGHRVGVAHILCVEDFDVVGRMTAVRCSAGPSVLGSQTEASQWLARLAACAAPFEAKATVADLRRAEAEAREGTMHVPERGRALVRTTISRRKVQIDVHAPIPTAPNAPPAGPPCDPATCKPPSCNCLNSLSPKPIVPLGPIIGQRIEVREQRHPSRLEANPVDFVAGPSSTITLSEMFPERTDGRTHWWFDDRFRVVPEVGMDDALYFSRLTQKMDALDPSRLAGPVERLAYQSNAALLASRQGDVEALKHILVALRALRLDVPSTVSPLVRHEALSAALDGLIANLEKVTLGGATFVDPCAPELDAAVPPGRATTVPD